MYSSSLNVRATALPDASCRACRLHILTSAPRSRRDRSSPSGRHSCSREVRMDRVGAVAPGPVPCTGGRRIHPALAAQVQNILHGNDAEVGNRSCSCANHGPNDLSFVSDSLEVDLCILAFQRARRLHATSRGSCCCRGCRCRRRCSVRSDAEDKDDCPDQRSRTAGFASPAFRSARVVRRPPV